MRCYMQTCYSCGIFEDTGPAQFWEKGEIASVDCHIYHRRPHYSWLPPAKVHVSLTVAPGWMCSGTDSNGI